MCVWKIEYLHFVPVVRVEYVLSSCFALTKYLINCTRWAIKQIWAYERQRDIIRDATGIPTCHYLTWMCVNAWVTLWRYYASWSIFGRVSIIFGGLFLPFNLRSLPALTAPCTSRFVLISRFGCQWMHFRTIISHRSALLNPLLFASVSATMHAWVTPKYARRAADSSVHIMLNVINMRFGRGYSGSIPVKCTLA